MQLWLPQDASDVEQSNDWQDQAPHSQSASRNNEHKSSLQLLQSLALSKLNQSVARKFSNSIIFWQFRKFWRTFSRNTISKQLRDIKTICLCHLGYEAITNVGGRLLRAPATNPNSNRTKVRFLLSAGDAPRHRKASWPDVAKKCSISSDAPSAPHQSYQALWNTQYPGRSRAGRIPGSTDHH